MENPDPLENRPPAIKALYRNYEQRAEEAKKHARCFLIVNFFLLVLAVFAVIYAQYLAIDDVGKYRQEFINGDKEKLEKIDNQTPELQAEKSSNMVASSDRPDVENKLEQQETEKERSDFSIVLFQMDFLRIGLLTVLILMSQHVIKLARYNFRLMTFYRARQDVLLMTTTEALPLSELTPKGLEQAANALSPDHVDPEISSKTPIEMLRQRASWRRKPTPGQ